MISRFIGFDENIFHNKIKGKKILVCGSGPSLKKLNLDDLDYDYIITCNNFFRYEPLFNNNKILFTTISPVCKFSHKLFKSYISTHPDCFLGSEENNNPLYAQKGFRQLKNANAHRYVNYWTDHHKVAPCIGTAGRLLYFALHFKPSVLYFSGIDGRSINISEDPPNTFRPEVGQVHTASVSKGCLNYKWLKECYLKMTEIIHKYCQDNNIELYNLGEGLSYNIPSLYSSKHFTLPNEIKNLLL